MLCCLFIFTSRSLSLYLPCLFRRLLRNVCIRLFYFSVCVFLYLRVLFLSKFIRRFLTLFICMIKRKRFQTKDKPVIVTDSMRISVMFRYCRLTRSVRFYFHIYYFFSLHRVDRKLSTNYNIIMVAVFAYFRRKENDCVYYVD